MSLTTDTSTTTLDPVTRVPGSAPVVIGAEDDTTLERRLVFGAALLIALLTGWRAVLAGVLPGDAYSRVANAAAAAVGRDPHLESIGFVWPPMPTIFQVPLVWFGNLVGGGVERHLVALGGAAVIVSAIEFALLASVIRGWAADLRLGRPHRLLVVAVVMGQPLMLVSGGNGMSEIGFLLGLGIAARHLGSWIEGDGRVWSLVIAGWGLALAVMHRTDALATVIAAGALLGVIVWRERAAEEAPLRRRFVLLDAVVLTAPALFCFLVTTLYSWQITGEPFAQFSSDYGNSAQVAAAGVESGAGRALTFGVQLLTVGLPGLIGLTMGVWLMARRTRALSVIVAIFLPPLLFQLATAITGNTFAFGRFTIAAVPLGGLALALLLADAPRKRLRNRTAVVASVGAVSMIVAGLAIGNGVGSTAQHGVAGLDTERLWGQALLGARLTPGRTDLAGSAREVADHINRLDLGDGTVLAELARTFPVYAAVDDRRTFVVTPDRDFERVVAAPWRFGVEYLLVSNPAGGAFDAVAASRPDLWERGGGIATLEREFGTAEQPATHYRLYKLTGAQP